MTRRFPGLFAALGGGGICSLVQISESSPVWGKRPVPTVWEIQKIGKDVAKNVWQTLRKKKSQQMSLGFWLKALFIVAENDISFIKQLLLSPQALQCWAIMTLCQS